MITAQHRCLLLLVTGVILSMPAMLSAQEGVSLSLEEGKSGAVWDLVLSPDGQTLYSCGRDSTAKSWDLRTGESIRIFKPEPSTLITALDLDHTGTFLALGDMQGRLSVWNARSGVQYYAAPAHEKYITGVAVTADGKTVVTAGRDDRIRLWRLDDGVPLQEIRANMLWVQAVAVSPDGALIAAAGQDGRIALWRVSDGSPEGDLGRHSRFARSLLFSADGRYLFSAGADGHVKVWDMETRALYRDIALAQGYAHTLDLDRGEEKLLVGRMNGTMEIWDWRRRILHRKLPATSYGTMRAVFDEHAGRILSAHTSGAVKIWRGEDATLLLDMVGFSDGQWLSFTPDGYYDCSAYGDRYVRWRRGQEVFPLERYAELYKRPSVIEDVLRGSYTPTGSVERIIDPPTVALHAPRDGQLFAFGSEPLEIIVEAEARDRTRVERIQLLRNGRQLSSEQIISQEVLMRKDTLLRMRYRVAVLPGRNSIEAVALNAARVRSAPRRAEVTVETDRQENPSLYVLAVGSDSYAPAFPDLQFASVDAESLADELARQEGGMYSRVYSRTLTNREATKENVFAALEAFGAVGPQDVLLLFFSGHGVRERDASGRTRYYYLPAGVTRSTLRERGMAWSDFARQISALNAGRVILLLDACHSGDVSEGASNEKVASTLAGDVGIVFTSSSGSEFSYEDRSWGHGAFTRALLDGLRGKADFTGDKVVDWSELQLYVSTAVRSMTKGSQNPMVPRLEQFVNFELVRVP
ncbi:MAG: caspase family protein [Bacteroidota bacterium]|nr:caspase family protein [Bacteroidota bacterium]